MARGSPGEEIDTPNVSPGYEPRRITPRASGVSIAPGIYDLGEALDSKYRADSAAWAGNQVADFRLKAAQALDDMKAKAPAGDPGNFTETYLNKFDELARPLTDSSITNHYSRPMVEQGIANLRNTLAAHTMEWEATQRVAGQNDSLQKNLDTQLPLVRAHPELAASVGQTLMQTLNASRNDPSTKLRFAHEMDVQLTHNAAMGLVDKDPGEVYTQLSSGKATDPVLQRLTDPVTRESVLDAARTGVVSHIAEGAVNAYRTAGPVAGQAAYAAVDKLTLPDEMKDKIRAGIQQRRGELIAEQQQTQAPKIMAVEESLRSGNPAAGTRARIWDLYHSNAMDPHATGAALGELDAIERKQALDKSGASLISEAWNGNRLLDPKDPEQKKDAAAWFDALTQKNQYAPGSQDWINVGAEFARRTGMIPDSTASWMRSTLVGSADPAQVVAAADAIHRFRDASPRSFQYFEDDGKLAAMSDSITNLTQSGVDPAQAVKMARDNAARADTHRKQLDEQWNNQHPFGTRDNALDAVLQAQIKENPQLAEQHWYGNHVPMRPQVMQADYANLTRQYFDYNGGNVTQAEQAAARDIAHVWGLTSMNGEPEIVKFPPERMFRAPDGGPGLQASDIRADIVRTVEDAGNPSRADLADLVAKPGSADTDASKWDKRADGSAKGQGWLGLLRRPDGGVSSELSMGVEMDGKEREIPLMVPSLTRPEVDKLLAMDPKDPNFYAKLPPSIKQKAVQHAQQQLASGGSPFYQAGSGTAFQHWDEAAHKLVPFHVEPDQVRVIQTPATTTTSGREWGLAYQTPDGVLEMLYGKNGKPLRYQVPVAGGDYNAARQAQLTKANEEANARYQAGRKQDAAEIERLQSDADNYGLR